MIFEKQIVNLYKGMMFTRCDDNGTAFYFSAGDFDGLHAEPFSFRATAGHTLQGYFYRYGESVPNRLVVFDHGFGGGHRSYMKEIEKLCAHGFCVFAYDHTGCMESGGASPNGMAQSLCDLNDCINALRADERFRHTDLSVMGHSWGGFSCLNIAALHPEISHIVVLSGFVSVEELVKTFFDGLMKGYRKAVLELEMRANPDFIQYHGVKSLSDTDAHVLLVYSDNDTMCKKVHYDILKKGLAHKENVRFLLVNGKGHNPNYTADAVQYLGHYVKQKNKQAKNLKTPEQKQVFLDSFDWNRMTAQDDAVWNEIFACLDRI